LIDLIAKMRERFPDVEIVGWHSPPLRTLSEQEDDDLVEMINSLQPDFYGSG